MLHNWTRYVIDGKNLFGNINSNNNNNSNNNISLQHYNAVLLHESFVGTNDPNLLSFQTVFNFLCF